MERNLTCFLSSANAKDLILLWRNIYVDPNGSNQNSLKSSMLIINSRYYSVKRSEESLFITCEKKSHKILFH